MNTLPILVITGPTASGKTDLAIRLAQRLNAEIISADSRQIYRGMEIGTAAPSRDDLDRAVHHFISIFDPDRPYSAGEFGEDARKKITDIRSRGRNIIVCGGSGMYIQAIFGMIYSGGESNSAIREEIFRKGEELGWDMLYRELQSKDPACADKISVNDTKRIARAFEIMEIHGDIPSRVWRDNETRVDLPQLRLLIAPERKVLLEQIEHRTAAMIEQGLVAETETLLQTYPADINALKSVGFQEIIDHLQGRSTLDQAAALINIHTRQFAKRQMTWFRRTPPDLEIDQAAGADDMILNLLHDAAGQ